MTRPRVKNVWDSPIPGDAAEIERVKIGSALFDRTRERAASFVGNDLRCASCHLDGGQRIGALPLAGSARRIASRTSDGSGALEDLIARCFELCLNGAAPPRDSVELASLAAYVRWLSVDLPPGPAPAWLRSDGIPPERRIPIARLDARRGRRQYERFCAACHGPDGAGSRERGAPNQRPAPPVWGSMSYSAASGLGRVHSLAGFLRFAMHWDEPRELSDVDAQDIAAFVNGQPRPLRADPRGWDGAAPEDAVYDRWLYPRNPFGEN